MTSLLGCHWIRTHPDGRDFDHVAKMQYRSVKTFEWMSKDRNFCADLLAALPRDSYILARNHPRSEQKEDVWRDPKGTGIRHADEWARDLKEGQCFLPTDRTFFLPVNEPDATSGDRNAIDIYTATYLDRLHAHGLRGGAFNFSTGHPRTVDGTPNTPPDYSVFERSHRVIVQGHHIAVAHIYGTAAIPCAPGHYDRLKACTWQDVEWVIGEMGADEHVIGGGNHDGYLISMNGHINDYCPWLDTLIIGIGDPRIHSYQVFTYDFSHPWDSFNVREIRDALESYQWRHMQVRPTPPDTPPVDIHLPNIGAAKTAFVAVPSGANFRTHRDTLPSSLIFAIPFGKQVQIVGYDENRAWARVEFDGKLGWIRAELLSFAKPDKPQQPTPAPQPGSGAAGILDPRVAQAILQIESGGRAHGENGKPIIRFEAHVFRNQTASKHHSDQFFRYNHAQPWTDQQWRKSEGDPWRNIHTGKQADEYAAFEFAKSIDREAAFRAISVGAGQILGTNHARIGYPTAEAMFNAFQSAPMQTIGFINYFLSDPALMDAMRRKDWREIAKRYNGAANVDHYAPLLEKAYRELGGN